MGYPKWNSDQNSLAKFPTPVLSGSGVKWSTSGYDLSPVLTGHPMDCQKYGFVPILKNHPLYLKDLETQMVL